jgi:hypothetical protein
VFDLVNELQIGRDARPRVEVESDAPRSNFHYDTSGIAQSPPVRKTDVWLHPGLDPLDERKKVRVEDLNAAGAVIFCHDYTMKEFTQAKWILVITERNDCPPE